MPSDERVTAALSALGPQIGRFRFSVSSALERARTTLAADSSPSQPGVALGDFANGRIDPERFAMISAGAAPLDTVGRSIVERAGAMLESLLSADDDEFVVEVESGASPDAAIRARLAKLGSLFGAASAVELVRRRIYDPGQHPLHLDGHPFEKWTASERKIAPPLVVLLDGCDLDAFELAPFLDGCVRLVLVVKEPCALAPLARLISPGVFVAQASDVKVLERFAGLDGPAVVAMMTGPEARFVHDPRGGEATWQRIEVTGIPSVIPRKSLGNRSGWQQRDDIAHLRSLADQPVVAGKLTDAVMAAVAGSREDPADRLTAWLLEQSSRAGVS